MVYRELRGPRRDAIRGGGSESVEAGMSRGLLYKDSGVHARPSVAFPCDVLLLRAKLFGNVRVHLFSDAHEEAGIQLPSINEGLFANINAADKMENKHVRGITWQIREFPTCMLNSGFLGSDAVDGVAAVGGPRWSPMRV